jgi:hypothetical protein
MAIPKKPLKKSAVPAKKKQEVLSSADFKKLVSGKKKVWDRSKKKDAPVGYVKDEEVIKMFGLRPGSGITVKARLVSASVVMVSGTRGEVPVAKFKFIVQEGEHQGTPLQGSDIWLPLDDDDELEKAFDTITFLLQKLGYETEDMTLDNLAEILAELTSEKPYCILYLNCYVGKSGKNKGVKKYGVRVNSAYTPDDDNAEDEGDEEDEEEDTEDDSEDDGEEEDSEESDEDSDGDDEPEYENDEEDDSEEEDSEEEGPDEDDPATWVGYGVIVPINKKKTTITVTKYDKKKKLLTGTDKAKKEHSFSPETVVDWA